MKLIPEYNDKIIMWRRDNNFDKSTIEEYFKHSNYAKGVLDLPQNSTVFDIGAYIGAYAIKLESLRPDLNIVSFEPEPINYGLLCRNLLYNSSNILPFQVAITTVKGTYKISTREHTGGWSIYVPSQGDQMEIIGLSLEDAKTVLGIKKVDYIKMDIEGLENVLLEKIPDSIWNDLQGMDIEFHPDCYGDEYQQDKRLDELVTYVSNRGLKPVVWTSIGAKGDFRRA
jgi:FkbM family methyltransferase